VSRTEYNIMHDLLVNTEGLADLEQEINGYATLSGPQLRAEKRKLEAERTELIKELGRDVDDDDIFAYAENAREERRRWETE
jgi:hypothetical protein